MMRGNANIGRRRAEYQRITTTAPFDMVDDTLAGPSITTCTHDGFGLVARGSVVGDCNRAVALATGEIDPDASVIEGR